MIHTSALRFSDYAGVIGTASKLDSIGKSALQMTTIMFPLSYDEQRKIGAFFRKFDDLISLYEQYTLKLTQLKKGLLQKMFPQK